jgi:hypothetical protein
MTHSDLISSGCPAARGDSRQARCADGACYPYRWGVSPVAPPAGQGLRREVSRRRESARPLGSRDNPPTGNTGEESPEGHAVQDRPRPLNPLLNMPLQRTALRAAAECRVQRAEPEPQRRAGANLASRHEQRDTLTLHRMELANERS